MDARPAACATRALVVLAVALAFLVINAASASAYIYWANFFPTRSIGRANLDGTGAAQSFIPGRADEGPLGVATFGDYIYWTNNGAKGTGSIGRAKLDGTEVDQNFITGATSPTALAIDGEHIYWTNSYVVPSAENPNGSIGRANLDGSDVDQAFITATVRPHGIAVDGKYIYWTNQWQRGSIGRANLKGTGINQDWIGGVGFHAVSGLAVTPRYLYWTVDNGIGETGSIGRIGVNGTDAGGPLNGPPARGPAITAAKLSPTVFPASSWGPAFTRARLRGSVVLSYRLSRATLTRMEVLRLGVGRRSGRRCLAGRRSGKGSSCIRFTSLGSTSYHSSAGRVRVRFTGRLNGRRLAPGRYRLALTPRSRSESGSTTYLSFRIRR